MLEVEPNRTLTLAPLRPHLATPTLNGTRTPGVGFAHVRAGATLERAAELLQLGPALGRQVARELGETMTDEELEEMIAAADLDKDGLISEEEFLRILKKGMAA